MLYDYLCYLVSLILILLDRFRLRGDEVCLQTLEEDIRILLSDFIRHPRNLEQLLLGQLLRVENGA